MRRDRYISFVLLLLFVIAFGSRISVGAMCNCDKHHHTHEHICCHCAEHEAECSNHFHTFSENSCILKFISSEYTAQLPSDDTKNTRAITTYTNAIIHLYSLIDAICATSLEHEVPSSRQYHFSLLEWYGVSYSLRAPPIFV